MKKQIFWLMAATMLCSAPIFTACDDDDENTPTEETTTKPVKDTDFTVSVSGTTVTIKSSLTYGNMWVTYAGTQYQLTDGAVTISIPVAGDYEMTFSYYNSATYTSDTFTVTITATDLSFLDEGVFKALTGGKEAYEAATADANGYKFTRSWRLDAFLTSANTEYVKSGYTGGVGFFGSDWWACAGSYKGSWQNDATNGITDCAEDATIAFDPVNGVVKFTVKTAYDTTYVQGMKANAGAYTAGLLEAGTYYTTFTYNKVAEQYGSDGAAEQILNNAGTTLSDSYLEIKFAKKEIGSNGFVRMPMNKIYAGWTSIFENQFLNIKLMTEETGNVLHTVVGRSVDGGAKAGDSEKDDCLLFYTYVADELDDQYTYSDEAPNYYEPINTSATVATLNGTWYYYEVPFNWLGWNIPETDGDTPAGTLLNEWNLASDIADWASVADGYADAKFVFDAEAGTCDINGTATTYTVENGVITFGAPVTFNAGSVSFTDVTTLNIYNAETGVGIFLGTQNGDKFESSVVNLWSGSFVAGGGLFNTTNWVGDWNTNTKLEGNGDYTLTFNYTDSNEPNGLYIEFPSILMKYPNVVVTINSIAVDGVDKDITGIDFESAKSIEGGDNGTTLRYTINNAWGTALLPLGTVTEKVEVKVTLSGM